MLCIVWGCQVYIAKMLRSLESLMESDFCFLAFLDGYMHIADARSIVEYI